MDTFSDTPTVTPKINITPKITINKPKVTIDGVVVELVEYEWYIFTLQECHPLFKHSTDDEQSSLRRIVLDGWEPVSITHTGPLLLALLAKRRT